MSIENLNGENLHSQQVNPGENLQTKQEIGEALDEKQVISQMIGKIEDKGVRNTILSYLSQGLYTPTKMKEELKAYNDSVDSFSSENLAELNGIISKYNLLPSVGLKELEIKTNILAESDPKVKNLMAISLKTKIRPSVIMQGKDIYKQLSTVENPEEKNLILHYLEESYTPKSVFDEYEIFGEIMSYPYKDENLKNFLLSLTKDEEVNPSFIELYFDLLKDKEFGEETENYIRELLNQPKK